MPGPFLPPDSLLFGPFFGAEVPLDAGEGRWPSNRDRVSTNLPTEQNIDTNIYQLRLAYDLGAASLVSVTGKIEADYDYLGEADMTAGDYTYIAETMGLDSFSQELRLQSIDNRERDELPSYSLWNLSAGVTKGSWRVAAYVENVFESEYHLSPSDVQARLPLSGDLVDVHPRSYGLTVSYQY